MTSRIPIDDPTGVEPDPEDECVVVSGQAVLAYLRLIGCNCQPEVVLGDGERLEVRHDEWCNLLTELGGDGHTELHITWGTVE